MCSGKSNTIRSISAPLCLNFENDDMDTKSVAEFCVNNCYIAAAKTFGVVGENMEGASAL